MGERIRVLIVEDSDVYRDTLVYLLGREEDLEVVGAVADGATALDASAAAHPDVVVLDYRLPDRDGGEIAPELRTLVPRAAIVFLSASAGQDEYDAASVSDAPLVRKDEGVEALVEAVRTVAGRGDG